MVQGKKEEHSLRGIRNLMRGKWYACRSKWITWK